MIVNTYGQNPMNFGVCCVACINKTTSSPNSPSCRERVEELEGVLQAVLESGSWYASALEIDIYKTEVMDGEALESMIRATLGKAEGGK